MKKFSFILAFIFLMSHFLFAQKFAFQLYFEDAKGNKDTLILGYDDSATEGIDPFFDETNIINMPWKDGLDVRVTDEWSERQSGAREGTFHTKKQIVSGPFVIMEINIKSDNYPLKAKWNSALFQNEDLEGSFLTSMNPGGWWDVFSPSNLLVVLMAEMDSIEFSSNIPQSDFDENHAYINESDDSLSVLWFVFGPEGTYVNTQSIEVSNNIEIYPNPVGEVLNIRKSSQQKIEKAILVNRLGQAIMETNNESINIGSLHPGYYGLRIYLQNGQIISKPVIIH